jgi:hypothetical protein
VLTPRLLTDQEVAEQLQVKPRTVAKLAIPFVRIGEGKGLKRWRQEDIDRYVNSRLVYRGWHDEKEKKTARRAFQGEPKQMGIPTLLSREQIHAIRVGVAGGGKKSSH